MANVAKGVAQLQAVLASLGPRLLEEGGRALYQEALDIQKVSMRRTPVETGALRASHSTSTPKLERGEVTVTIEVGGPAAPYCIPVHERLDLRHPVGEPKFLEKSVLEATAGMGERVARRIDLSRAIK